jgi:hypothetical protein
MNDLRTLDSNMDVELTVLVEANPDLKKLERLETDVYDALVSFLASSDASDCIPHTHVLPYAQYTIRGLQYAESKAGGKNAGSRNSIIFFEPEPGMPLVPGLIRKIFSIPQNEHEGRKVFIAVERYKPLSGSMDPFARYAEFGAGLWLMASSDVEIITPSHKMCHGIRRTWKAGVFVMKPLNQVSRISDQ